MRSRPLRLLLPVALATGLVVRRRRRGATPAPTPPPPGAGLRPPVTTSTRPARGRRGHPVALAVLVAAVVAPLAPASSEGPCEPTLEGMRLVVADLGGDGDVRTVTTEVVGLDGTRCTTAPDPDLDALGLRVGILHTDPTGAAVEPTRLTVSDVPITTRVRVTDTTRERTALVADGPDGTTRDTRELGVPRSVRVTVRYPSGWPLTAAPAAGTAVHDGRGGVEVTRSVLLFPPFTPDHVIVSTQAQPGRGTPTVVVESAPADAATLRTLLGRTDDRAALAVLGALLDLSADGAGELADGAGELADGLDELADATAELADGVDELADGVDELADGVQDLLDGVDELVDGVRALRDGGRDLARGLGEVAEAAPALIAGVDQLLDAVGGTEGLGGLVALAEGLSQAAPLLDTTTVDALELFPGGFAANLDALAGGLTATQGGLATGLTGLRGGLVGLTEGLDALADGGDALADGLGGLLDGVRELRDGVAELRNGTRELADGVRELADGTRELADATREVADGARELADGAEELPEALRDILAIADRRAATLALDEAAVDAGLARADAQRGGAALVSVRLEHTGQQALPVMAAATGGGALALAGGLGWIARSRRRA